MLISLANVESSNFWERLGILVIIAFVMTIGVYGVVAVLVKMDDVGVRLAQWPGKSLPALGRGLVKGMPHVFTVLSVVGTIAMLWVGGHIVVKSLYDIGLVTALYDVEHTITHAVEAAGGVVQWLAATLYSAVVGCVWGIAIVGIVAVVSKIRTGTSTH
jgi:predicted DNA repair protein MutK